MEIPLYLAMTAGEMLGASRLPEHPAWMACHFSPYGRGLSNLPTQLPPGAMLMLNDRIPSDWHDPNLVACILSETAERLQCSCILLDFQREDMENTAPMVEAVLKVAKCPVGISEICRGDFSCPVLLPPVPAYISLEEYLEPWKGQEIWLEVSREGTQITLTQEGSQYTPLPHYIPEEPTHPEPELHCHYKIEVTNDRISFYLGRTDEDLTDLLNQAQNHGVTKLLALWQEMGCQDGRISPQ